MAFAGGFTVLMAVHAGDAPGVFDAAVRSVFSNTLRPDAFVLVVDGAAPKALERTIGALEAEFAIQVARLPARRGLAAALNAGLGRVQTAWVMRADADDFNLPGRFERLAAAVATEPDVGLIGSAILEVDESGRPIASRRPPLTHAEIVAYAKRRNPFNHMTVAFQKSVVEACGGYPELHLREDYGLWATLLQAGVATRNVADVLVHARAGPAMYRRRGGVRYAVAELELQRHLVRCGLKGPLQAARDGFIRAAAFLLPAALRGRVYERWLRSA